MIDRRHSAGGHWLDAYPFVRLHQASEFYGVVSTPLGDGGLQLDGPEAGMHHRAPAAEIVAYYTQVTELQPKAPWKPSPTTWNSLVWWSDSRTRLQLHHPLKAQITRSTEDPNSDEPSIGVTTSDRQGTGVESAGR
jgi:hypothetical protein